MPDYFYGPQAEQFAFYRIPKALFTDPAFRSISTDAKVLYGLLLDRMSLSARNDWLDEQGRVYIVFTVEEIMESLACGNKKAVGLLRELEVGAGLIERRRQGLGKPNLIYVKNFIEGNFLKCPNDTSVSVQSTVHDVSKGHGNKTDKNYTDLSETDPFLSDVAAGTESEGKDDRTLYQEYFARQLGFDALIASYPEDEDMLREMLELLVDTVCSKRRFIRIAGDDKPAEVVKAQLMKLNNDHLRFVLMCLKENTTQVRNMRQYLLATLYNAPMTMHSSYAARV
ncbi:replication initiator A domain-containing protein, partial [Faecalibacterium sp. An58]|uniref:DUF6017 domain-containing protein n=1 Tax=Faecalibacterium sp. An58 TaxID=1965648 RepID=UPI000B3A489C